MAPLTAALFLLAGLLAAQEPAPAPAEGEKPAEEEAEAAAEKAGPPTAYFVARAITMSGEPVAPAVIVVKDGKISAIGKEGEVEVPSGAKRVEARSQVAMPGFVHAASTCYVFGPIERYGVSGTASKADESVRGRLDPSFKDAERMARGGFTTVAVIPTGGGFPGQGVLVKPVRKGKGLLEVAQVVREDDALLAMAFEAGTATKEQWTKALEKSRQYIKDLEAWNKAQAAAKEKKPVDKKEEPKAEEKKAEGTPAKPAEEKKAEEKKPDEKKGEEKKDEKKPEEKKPEDKKADEKKIVEPTKDAKLMPLVSVLERKLPGILVLPGAASFLHFQHLFESEKAFRPALLFSGFPMGQRWEMDAWRVLEKLKELKLPVILPATVSLAPFGPTRRVNPRLLLDAGVAVALVPSQPDVGNLEDFRIQLIELVRYGLTEEEALRAATLTPAQILGLQERCGSLAAGRDADFLLFDGDPLAPTSSLLSVFVGGQPVWESKEAGS